MNTPIKTNRKRLKVALHGLVQGVGFRPFVYHLAAEMGLTGWVKNSSQGLFIEAEGHLERLENFLERLHKELPPQAFIQSFDSVILDPRGYDHFEILESDASGLKTALILPDLAPCRECVRDIFDPNNRRYEYPFTNCTHCGPRYSIIEAMPYDRANTSMKKFRMCAECHWEYDHPDDRRFHAQPNACPRCGPKLYLWDGKGREIAAGGEALELAVQRLNDGKIAAVKGVGGFHLICDAHQEKAVIELRERKRREEKPFALVAPNLRCIEKYCEVSEQESRLLLSAQAPIVLLKRKIHVSVEPVASSAAPENPNLGIMMPPSPLHYLLSRKFGKMLIATSGNLAEEPLVTHEEEAVSRLSGIADFYLVHDRRIVRPLDDSVVRIMAGRTMVLRRGRGYAPMPAAHTAENAPPMIAVGAHLKNTIAQNINGQVFMSQHIGDLDNAKSYDAFHETLKTFKCLYETKPEIVVSDLHPDYASSKYAEHCRLPRVKIQHHYAHALSGMADNEIEAPVLAVCWDGAGLGSDETVWGGEFLRIHETFFFRAGHFRRFRLLGGDKAAKDPRRAALGVLYEIFGDSLFKMRRLNFLESFTKNELGVLHTMLRRGIQSPWTTSAGRLFDAIAALTGIRTARQYEGQAAAQLEFAAEKCPSSEIYPIWMSAYCPLNKERIAGEAEAEQTDTSIRVFDWEPVVRKILGDLDDGVCPAEIAAKFHNTLAEVIVLMAKSAREEKVLLTGGCFQNRYLLEKSISELRAAGYKPYWHQRIPCNDGGISAGQIAGASRVLVKKIRKEVIRCA